MALNSFFLQGSPGEQRLVQEIVNEHLKIYGVEVLYIPRKFVRKDTILNEVTTSRFDDNFTIEAYVNNFDGYSGSGDILTKFGMSLRDELTLTISQERFQDFIVPFLEGMDENEITVSSRPREGDVIYFPLGKRLFEVKFVEHEQPFYQLGKNYTYELKCELFEFEDEIGGFSDVSAIAGEMDTILENQGYITKMELFAFGESATGTASTVTNYVRRIILNDDGNGYIGIPTVSISPAPSGGINATAVAITTSIGDAYSIQEILLTNPGVGYTIAPSVTIYPTNGGVGAAATSEIVTTSYGIGPISITSPGEGYATNPIITIDSPGDGVTATAITRIGTGNTVTEILIRDAGYGYTEDPSIDIADPPLITGIGTYSFNETIRGEASQTTSRVKNWDKDTNILTVGVIDGDFILGEVIVGTSSNATYALKKVSSSEFIDKYEQNEDLETEADQILDFTEKNPFGNY